MKTIKDIATTLGVSVQTVRNHYRKLPPEHQKKNGKSFALDEKSESLLIQSIQGEPQNQNKIFAKVLQSDSSEVLAYFERIIREKDEIIMQQQRQIGMMEQKLLLTAPEDDKKKKLWKKFWKNS